MKSLLYFEVVSTVAMLVGFVLVNVVEPGVGLHATGMNESSAAIKATAAAGEVSVITYLLSLIPHTLWMLSPKATSSSPADLSTGRYCYQPYVRARVRSSARN